LELGSLLLLLKLVRPKEQKVHILEAQNGKVGI